MAGYPQTPKTPTAARVLGTLSPCDSFVMRPKFWIFFYYATSCTPLKSLSIVADIFRVTTRRDYCEQDPHRSPSRQMSHQHVSCVTRLFSILCVALKGVIEHTIFPCWWVWPKVRTWSPFVGTVFSRELSTASLRLKVDADGASTMLQPPTSRRRVLTVT